ncbi:hypothetical protein ABOM_002739 [Aspergillus bombycis]|uniref:Uncharacterized protein n=1 Tax=Aspergillus bombycis TaxID=109264 RepID=A0A1F8A898_9EURO|nr:hypothetical protein ABOM_002739 [Aspergillus bombycis]OGM47927.1 hypothetical protein ABOM_002739 [Aspergillus bombycis]
MTSPSFILPSLLLNPIAFVDPFPSQWRLTSRLDEYSFDMKEGETKYGLRVPYTRALFGCEEVGNPGHKGYVLLYMQIPFEGTEFAAPDVRAHQASLDLPYSALDQYTCYQTLKNIGSEHTPTLIGSKKESQGQDSWVPGGYLFYIAFSKVPGVRILSGVIGEGLFYTLPLSKRDQIREAFKVAYTSFAKSGVLPSWDAQRELYWDEHTGKLYIAGPFERSTDAWEWDPDLWEFWFLDEGEVTKAKSTM